MGRLPAALPLSALISHSLTQMKSFIAQSILWSAYVFGLCLGLSFCLAVGAGLGQVIAQAPITGAISGLAYWSFGYFHTADQGYQRVLARVKAVKAAA